MSDIKCNIVKDILPLYIDELVSDETKQIIENHLKYCDECVSYLKSMSDDMNIEVQVEKNEIDKKGEKIVKEIKKSQDRIKYTFIIFSMIVAVSNGWLSRGFMSTIPLIIIIPFVLSIFFKEGKVIVLSAVCLNLILAIAKGSLDLGLISTPLLIVAVISGILLGKVVKIKIDGGI
ncbi:MAG: zf-HC2 domain-containing protein [Peptostreptococcaceae bacterium]